MNVGDSKARSNSDLGFSRRLAVRLIIFIVLFSTALTVGASAFQLYQQYREDVSDVRVHLDQVKRSTLPGITENMWLLDRDRLLIQLEGIVGLPDFLYAGVIGPSGEILAQTGRIGKARALIDETPLTHTRRGRNLDIGTLRLAVSLDAAVNRTVERAGFIFVSNAIITTLLAVFIYFLVHHLITRHMQDLARYARAFSLEGKNEPLALNRKERLDRSDELSDLVGAVNEMRAGLQASYASLRDLNESLEARVATRTAELSREIGIRTQAEADLRDALNLNEKIAAKSPVGIIILDADGTFISANDSAGKIVGADPDRLVGLNYRSLSSWRDSGMTELADRAFADDMPQHDPDMNVVTIFGRAVEMDCHFVPFSGGGQRRVMLMFSDVSEARRAERALRDSEQMFRDYAEAASQWFWETDDQHRFVGIHGGGPTMIGLPREKIIGFARWDAISKQDYERDPEGWEQNRADMETHRLFRGFEYAITGEDGRVTYVSINGKPVFGEDGRFMGYRGTGHDITARREIEIQLIQASKMATLGEMATGVAHELNQPLNVIRLAAANIERKARRGDVDSGYLADKLDRIMQNVERAAAIIDHMRVFGRKEVATENIQPCAVVRDSVGMMARQLKMADITVDLLLPDDFPVLRANAVKLEQVLLNLIGNARDALNESAVADKRIEIELARRKSDDMIDVPAFAGVSEDGVVAAIFVRDNAGGIPEGLKDRIFEPFFTTKEAGKGTGLGLSISYGIIKEMGGHLLVANTGAGAEFSILLPIKAPRAVKTAADA